MQNWYSREFMSSSQAAAKLVFNIENCVDMSRVLNVRPTRPPDSHGRESFVYLMDGGAARTVKDLTLDELSPWNSKKCKSSTRFSSLQFDNNRNSLIFNRYILSDTSAGNFTPECLFACYYCKHPVFDLVKKIFYACDGNREKCLPGTFVIFVYEFNRAERLYRTQRYLSSAQKPTLNPPNFGAKCAAPQLVPPTTIQSTFHLNNLVSSAGISQINPNPVRHFLESSGPLKLENFSEWGDPIEDDQSYDFDALFSTNQQADLSTPSSTSCLENILQSCTEAASIQQLSMANPSENKKIFGTNSNPPSSSTQLVEDDEPANKKRRKITFRALDQQNGDLLGKFSQPSSFEQLKSNQSSISSLALAQYSPGALSSHNEENDVKNENEKKESEEICHFFTTESLLENFRKNCLCDARLLGEHLERMDEKFLEESAGSDNEKMMKMADSFDLGGCLIVDYELPVGQNLSATFLWFRNPTFVDRKTNQPIIHPVAILLKNDPNQNDCRQFLLDELKGRLDEEEKFGGKICRSLLIHQQPNKINNQNLDLDNFWSLDSDLIRFPCIRLISGEQCKMWIRQKFNTNVEEEESQRIEEELFKKGDGILESISFEQFVSRQRVVEKRWPNTFRSWFREKSGWIFEHCSLGSQLKAGFGENEFDLNGTVETLREEMRQSIETATIQQGEGGQSEYLETVIEALETICTEFLRKALNALLDPIENDDTDEGIIPAKRVSWIGKKQWEQFSVKARSEHLSPLGLSSLLNIAESLDPALFWGLNRTQKREILSSANCFTVMEINLNGAVNGQQLQDEANFVVFNRTNRIANFVQFIDKKENGILYCQCRGSVVNLCQHVLAVVMKHPNLCSKMAKFLRPNTNNAEAINRSGLCPSNSSAMPGLQLENHSVEIICCSSSNGSS